MTIVSFIVPCFNKERFIQAVITHVDAQIGDFEKEIIIVNDGSTDKTGAICDAIAENRKDIHVIHLNDDGPAIALNRAAAMAKGDFLKFVDGDDLLRTDATALLLPHLDDPTVSLAHGPAGEYESADIGAIAPRPATPLRATFEHPLGALRETLHHIAIIWSGCLVRRADFIAMGGCDERVFVHDGSALKRLARRGRIVDCGHTVVDRPYTDPERWSHRQSHQVFHDGVYSTAWFLNDYPDLPLAIRRYAYRRCAGRGYKWRVRRDGFLKALPAWFRHVLSRSPWLPRYDLRCWGVCPTFEVAGPLRRPGGSLRDSSDRPRATPDKAA